MKINREKVKAGWAKIREVAAKNRGASIGIVCFALGYGIGWMIGIAMAW